MDQLIKGRADTLGMCRAGSTGVAFLMYMEQLGADDAVAVAQCLRPAIGLNKQNE